jgi:Ca2+/Na+ antiporter
MLGECWLMLCMARLGSSYMNWLSMACAGPLIFSQCAAVLALIGWSCSKIEWISACESTWLGLAAGSMIWSLLARIGSISPLQGCCFTCWKWVPSVFLLARSVVFVCLVACLFLVFFAEPVPGFFLVWVPVALLSVYILFVTFVACYFWS